MKLSARTRYAARILLELARSEDGVPLSASTLSQRTGVSAQFVEQILKPLKQHGLTTSVRGALGGYNLARPADQITLGEVVRLMEGGIQLSVCCGENSDNCPRKDMCLIRDAWVEASNILEQELDSISLATLLVGGLGCPVELEPRERKKSVEKRPPEPVPHTMEQAADSPRRLAVRRLRGRRVKHARPVSS